MFERSRKKIIRWKKYKLSDDPMNYYRVELMLTLPWRNEVSDLVNIDHLKLYQENKEKIFFFVRNKDRYVFDASIEEALDQAYGEAENTSNKPEDIFDTKDDPTDPLHLIIIFWLNNQFARTGHRFSSGWS